MNKWCFALLVFFATCFVICDGKEPFKPVDKTIPFMVYYTSRYRGICMGTLVSRMVVLTAASCVINPEPVEHDTRAITVVCGTSYRHPRRGIRVQVTKLIVPKIPLDAPNRVYLVHKTVAIMLLKRKVPDILAEVAMRGIEIDWKKPLNKEDDLPLLQEQCLMPGWHFHYKGDKIFETHKFLLQRNIRVQFLDVAKMHLWCDALLLKLQKSLDIVGYEGVVDMESQLCVRDPDQSAQPCHGMYGAPLVCRGRVMGILMAPDGQWTNCTGMTNIVHKLNADHMQDFFACVQGLFEAEYHMDWERMKRSLFEAVDEKHDFVHDMYDKILPGSNSWSSEL